MDVTTDGPASVPRGGVTGVALELLSSGARGAARAPITLLRLPRLALQQVCSVTGAVRSGTTGLAERGLSLVRDGSADQDAVAHPTGYLAEPESLNGEYAEFSPDFGGPWDAASAASIDPEMVSDADADLIAELGTDFSADLAGADASAADLAAAEPAAAELAGAADQAAALDAKLSAADLEAAVADLNAAAEAETGRRGQPRVDSVGPVPPIDPKDAVQPDGPVDIVTRAVVVAEEAAADGVAASIDRGELPIADFDHVTAGSLRGRLRRLELPELRTLRSYEQEHGSRLPILTLLENRIAKLEAAAGTA